MHIMILISIVYTSCFLLQIYLYGFILFYSTLPHVIFSPLFSYMHIQRIDSLALKKIIFSLLLFLQIAPLNDFGLFSKLMLASWIDVNNFIIGSWSWFWLLHDKIANECHNIDECNQFDFICALLII